MPIQALETDSTRALQAKLDEEKRKRKQNEAAAARTRGRDTLIRAATGLAPAAGMAAGGVAAALTGDPSMIGAGTKAGEGLSGFFGLLGSEASRQQEADAVEGVNRQRALQWAIGNLR